MLLMLRPLSIKLHFWLAIVSTKSLIYNTRLGIFSIVDDSNSIMAIWFFFCVLIPSISFLSQVCYARILDLKRKFLEAALRYYDISQIEKRQIGDE